MKPLRTFEFFTECDLQEFFMFDIPVAAWWWICQQLSEGTIDADDIPFEVLDRLQGTNCDVMLRIPAAFQERFGGTLITFTEQDHRVWLVMFTELRLHYR